MLIAESNSNNELSIQSKPVARDMYEREAVSREINMCVCVYDVAFGRRSG
jgi:hypothetical protein